MSRISPLFEVCRFADAIVYRRPVEACAWLNARSVFSSSTMPASCASITAGCSKRAGYEVDEALNGLEALEKLLADPAGHADRRREHAADGRDHLPRRVAPASPAAVRRFRRSSSARKSGPQDIAAARAAGANFYLVKPLSPETFGAVCRACSAGCPHERVSRAIPDGSARARGAGDRAISWRSRAAPSTARALDGAFRAFHTLKGGAGIVDFAAMSRAMHAAEDVLSAVRAGDRPVTPALIGDCLACLDQVVQWLDAIEDNGDLPPDARCGRGPHRRALRWRRRRLQATAPSACPPRTSRHTRLGGARDFERAAFAFGHRAAKGPKAGWFGGQALRQCAAPHGRADAAQHRAGSCGKPKEWRRDAFDARRSRSMRADISNGNSADANAPAAPRADPLSRTLRVEVRAGERARESHGRADGREERHRPHRQAGARAATTRSRPRSADEHARLDRLVGEAAARSPRPCVSCRCVRYSSDFRGWCARCRRRLGKTVRLVDEGDETEADKAIVEMLFEPLLHVVRNAMDHGIESAPERVAAGKPAVGTSICGHAARASMSSSRSRMTAAGSTRQDPGRGRRAWPCCRRQAVVHERRGSDRT